jgi:hypothetical protein
MTSTFFNLPHNSDGKKTKGRKQKGIGRGQFSDPGPDKNVTGGDPVLSRRPLYPWPSFGAVCGCNPPNPGKAKAERPEDRAHEGASHP